MNKLETLAKYLGIDVNEVEQTTYNDNEFETPEGDYLVLTDSEADEAAEEYIKETLWAFNSSFLSYETEIDEEVFKAIQDNGRCESNNDAILSIISSTCGLGVFCESVIEADGRGHFLSGYDGEEVEEGEYFIYRTN